MERDQELLKEIARLEAMIKKGIRGEARRTWAAAWLAHLKKKQSELQKTE